MLAVYYAWYDQGTWASGTTSDLPADPYNSDDPAVIGRQISEAQSAGVDGFELNWWGPGNRTDANLQTLLRVAHGSNFKVTTYVDLNGPGFNSPGDVASALTYLKHYFSDPSWFQFEGKPFVAFYNVAKFSVADWQGILGQVDPGRKAFWMTEGIHMEYLNAFDGIHPFSIAWAPDPAGQLATFASAVRQHPGKTWMATVMPGYDDTRLGRGAAGFAVDRANGGYYANLWQGAIATHPDIVSITSWNEWTEGSQIEPSRSYGDAYLRLTKQWTDAYRAAMGPAPPPPSSPDSAFYPQAGAGKGGFTISNAGGISFYSSFLHLGGVNALGYPSSQRFTQNGFTYQALQGAVLQWRPELGTAVLANTFEWFTDAGKDDQLLASQSIPLPIRDDGSGGDFNKAKAIRLSWLTDDAIKGAFLVSGNPDQAIQLYGLPMSKPEKHGPFIVQRFQRIAFQHWTDSVPGMPAPGSVVRVLGGDLAKQLGLIPTDAQQPSPAP
ncbi:MAG TPA: endo-1,3-alpha-glucanase family glycosylhydrolase [Chloroflexota bacterium]